MEVRCKQSKLVCCTKVYPVFQPGGFWTCQCCIYLRTVILSPPKGSWSRPVAVSWRRGHQGFRQPVGPKPWDCRYCGRRSSRDSARMPVWCQHFSVAECCLGIMVQYCFRKQSLGLNLAFLFYISNDLLYWTIFKSPWRSIDSGFTVKSVKYTVLLRGFSKTSDIGQNVIYLCSM